MLITVIFDKSLLIQIDINSHIYRNNEHPQQEILYFHEIEEIDENNINNIRYFYLESTESIQNNLNINHDTNAQKTTEGLKKFY